MKTNYTVKNYLKAVLVTTSVLTAFSASAVEPVLKETIVFTDDYERSDLDGGIPATTYTIVKGFISGTDADNPDLQGYDYDTGKMLRIAIPKTSVGRNGVFGNLSDYSKPFNAKLNDTAVDSVVWTFNMRDNRGTPAGFNDGEFGTAVILLSDAANYTSANGYAVVAYGANAAARKYRLVKFTNGIDATSKLTTIAEIFSSLTTTAYFSIRTVYVKSTNTWKLYGRIDSPASGGATVFVDPTTNTFDEVVEGVDDTFVNTTMTHFGFFLNCKSYSTPTNLLIDNYTVRTYHMDLGVGVNQPTSNRMYHTKLVPNGVQIEAAAAKATLYDITGKRLSVVEVKGQATINVPNKGLYLLKVALPDNRIATQKLMID